jgi:WD40 repeat protein
VIRKFLPFLSGFLMLVFALPIFAQQNTPIVVSNHLEVITAENAGKITAFASPDADTKHISISPDGTLIAVVFQHSDLDYNILIYNMQDGAEISHMQGRMDFFSDLLWSPDSKRIAVFSARTTGGGVEERSVKTYTIEKGANSNYYGVGNSDTWYAEDVDVSSNQAINPVAMAWNPSSNLLAVAFHDKAEVYDINADKLLFSAQFSGIKTVDWSPDGKVIITQSVDKSIALWGVVSTP